MSAASGERAGETGPACREVTSSVGDGEPLPGVSVVLDLVDQCDGVVLDADLVTGRGIRSTL